MLCLTEGAKDECNVVEVVARDHDNQEIAVPVANLRLSCQPMVSWSRSFLSESGGTENFGIDLQVGGPARLSLSFLSSSSVWMISNSVLSSGKSHFFCCLFFSQGLL